MAMASIRQCHQASLGRVVLDRLSYNDAAAASYEQAMAHISRHFVPFMLDAGHLAAGHRLTRPTCEGCSRPQASTK
jgi:hypothetical protein